MSKEIKRSGLQPAILPQARISSITMPSDKLGRLKSAIRLYIAGLPDTEIQGLYNLPELSPKAVANYLNGLNRGLRVGEVLAQRIILAMRSNLPELSERTNVGSVIQEPALTASGAAPRGLSTSQQRPEDYAMLLSTRFLPNNKIAIVAEQVELVTTLIALGTLSCDEPHQRADFPINSSEPDKEIVLGMLEQTICEVAGNEAEQRTNSLSLLQMYRDKFKEAGDVIPSLVYSIANPVQVPCNTSFFRYSEAKRGHDPSILSAFAWVYKVGLGFQQDVVREMNKLFNNPLIQKLMTTLFLKEAFYIDEFYKNPKVYRRMIVDAALFQQQFNECLASGIGGLEVVERAKMLVAKQLDSEYRGFVVALQYLHRQGINLEPLQDLNLESTPFLKLFAETIPQQMEFITPEGKIDEKSYKFYLAIRFTNNWRSNRSQQDPLKNAIDTIIRFYIQQNRISKLEPKDYDKLFAFVHDEYYLKI